MAEEQKSVQEQKPEETKEEGLKDLLFKQKAPPSQGQIEQWKMLHGDVFVAALSESEVFVFRALRRPEWVQLQTLINNPEAKLDQFKVEEMICGTCVLWKSIDEGWDAGKAGTPGTLQEMIMQNSNFMSPQAASIFVAKL